ncbi:hypothetical protein [Corallococcus sp. EGB]|uniref:hypothetical protein n=1 Tax=Corallococcus sp. EGB TaxID=1521117 RepID=UPI001CBB904E|nr:hypothetical protein [Corallococcus sp. EGB]
MNLKALLLAVLLVGPLAASAQIKISKVFDQGEGGIFVQKYYDEMLTRQNSCGVYLSDFYFSEVREGQYIVILSIAFQELPLGGVNAVTKKEIRVLFDDVISTVDKNKQIKLSLSDKALGGNQILSDTNNVHVEVRLVKVRDNYRQFFDAVGPLLNVAVALPSAVQALDKLVDTVAVDENRKNWLVFSADLYVPANAFENAKIRDDNVIPLLLNNKVYAIALGGGTPLPDDSVMGKVGSLINSSALFVSGKRIIKPSEAKYSGLVRLYFTKDTTPILPQVLADRLKDIDAAINGPDTAADRSGFGAMLRETAAVAGLMEKQKTIDAQANFAIGEYLKIAKICESMRTSRGDAQWQESFGQWARAFETRGAAYGGQAVGVLGIYDSQRVAKIFLPSGLSDDMIMSFYTWQLEIHNTLKAQNIATFSAARPAAEGAPPIAKNQ